MCGEGAICVRAQILGYAKTCLIQKIDTLQIWFIKLVSYRIMIEKFEIPEVDVGEFNVVTIGIVRVWVFPFGKRIVNDFDDSTFGFE